MATTSYDPEVWKMIREVWEVSPLSTSWKTILEQVAEALNTAVPSIPTVTRKQAREKWCKANKKAAKKGLKTTNKKLEKIVTHTDNKTSVETDDYVEFFTTEKPDDFSLTNDNENHSALVALEKAQQPSKAIRERLSDPAKLVRTMRSQAVSIFSIEVMVTEGTCQYLNEISKARSPEEIELATAKMAAFAGTSEVFDRLSRGHERMIKSLAGLHGLDPDDFKDKQARSEATLIKIEGLKEKSAAKMRNMREQQRIFLLRDVAAMDAGEPPPDGGFIVDHPIPYDGFDEIDGGYADE
ncbi:MAG: hypothetical protein VXW65_12905 [Pseudomonadota bacterium]|nr:hypothetical protein [Pseudomonadota bacterium]